MRPFLELKTLNRFVRIQKFCMESLRSVVTFLHQGDLLASIDIKDAYLHVPICQGHQPFLVNPRYFAVGKDQVFVCMKGHPHPILEPWTSLIQDNWVKQTDPIWVQDRIPVSPVGQVLPIQSLTIPGPVKRLDCEGQYTICCSKE